MRTSHRLSGPRLSGPRLRGPRLSGQRGFTLLEIMVATVVTLLMMISLVQVFKIIGDSMKQGRAALQMNSTLRAATFRLRTDLGNLTIRVDPPASIASGAGYFEYTDGSMTDYTAALFDPQNDSATNPLQPELPTQVIRSSRFGDVDDILMFTARSTPGSWFTGRAPANVVNSGAGTDTTPVTIASQLAEIVVFARPVKSNVTGGLFDDVDNNSLPDSYHLYYRTLLIRPDLNTATFNGEMCLANLTVGSANNPATALDMAPLYQICDLSMRRVYDGDQSTVDHVSANSLEDLMDPANRFAHYQFDVPTASTTMPLLVLDPIPQTSTGAGTAISVFANLSYPDPTPVAASLYRGNFLNPAFVLSGVRLGEDILMNNVLAFDVKAFDPGAPVVIVVGPDGASGTSSDTSLGADGSDDVILTPNDPGFASYAISNGTTSSNVQYRGAYVDLLWGQKALNCLSAYSMNFQSIRNNVIDTNVTPNRFLFQSELSGIDGLSSLTGNFPPLIYSDGLLRSGKRVLGNVQATYDTWTTRYDSDGRLQAALDSVANGVMDVDNYNRKNNSSSNTSDSSRAHFNPAFTNGVVIDAGSDGIDNNNQGNVDEIAERETLPPFPIKIPGVKISIRAEDQGTRQVRQMSVITEFVTQ